LLGAGSLLSTPKHEAKAAMSKVSVMRDIVFFMVDILGERGTSALPRTFSIAV